MERVLILLCVFAGLVLLAVIAGVSWKYRFQFKRLIKGQDVTVWLNRYYDLPRDAEGNVNNMLLAEMPPAPEGWDRYWRVRQAKGHIARAVKAVQKAANDAARQAAQEVENEQYRQQYAAKVAQLKQVASRLDIFDELVELFGWGNAWPAEEWTWVHETLTELAPLHCDKLITEAREGNRESFLRLHAYTVTAYSIDNSPYHEHTKTSYQWTPDFDELMVKFLKNPSLKDFKNQKPEFNKGECCLLAAEALRSRSMVKAKLVLALCKVEEYFMAGRNVRLKNFPFRQEIGAVLLADVAKLVDQLHVEDGIFVARAATRPTTT